MLLPARVDAGIHLARAQVPPKLYHRLVEAFSAPNPVWEQRRRLGKSTWGLAERLHFVEERKEALRLPRGAIGVLRSLAREFSLELAFEDGRVVPTERLPRLHLPGLRDYQEAAVAELEAATQGTFVLPTGAGKTRTALACIARLRTPTLILVGSRDLATQWQEEIRTHLGIEAGLVAGGEYSIAPVTVALAQALARKPADELEAFLECFGFLITDEAHHAASDLFRTVVDRSPSKFRLGLTATPKREDGLTPLLGFYFGPVLAQVSFADLQRRGLLLIPKVRRLETDFDYPYASGEDFKPMLDALVSDARRNELIVQAVAAEVATGHSCLVLSNRKEHCMVLAGALDAAGVKAAAVTGKVAKRRRTQLLRQVRDGELPVLVATTLADEGLDLPRLSRAFLTFPSKAEGRTVQRLGRILRPHPAKTDAVLVDVLDPKVAVLRRHAAARRRAYEPVLGLELLAEGARREEAA
jgi:superfamily II DNA or RNA helicase